MMMDDGGGGGGGYTPPGTRYLYQDPEAGLNPQRATPADFIEGDESDEGDQRGRGTRAQLRIPRYGSGAGSNTG